MKKYRITLKNGFEKEIEGVEDIDFNDDTHIRFHSEFLVIAAILRTETLLIEEAKEEQNVKV